MGLAYIEKEWNKMDKIVEIKREVFNPDFFIVGDFYKFKLKDSPEFEIRQLRNIDDENATFSIGKYNVNYNLQAFINAEETMEVTHYASYRDVLKLI